MAGTHQFFEIHPTSGVPIYRQIIEQVRTMIAGGKLQPGDMLPSVRKVAQAAAINPMTVSKAYSRLEADQIVDRVRGQGMRVSKTAVHVPLKQRRQQFHQLAQAALVRGHQLGLTESQIREILDSLIHANYQDPYASQLEKEYPVS